MLKIVYVFVIVSFLVGCGLAPSVKKVDTFGETVKSAKKVGVLVCRFSMVDKKNNKLDSPVSSAVSTIMERSMRVHSSSLPFETVLLPCSAEIDTKLMPEIDKAYKTNPVFQPNPRKIVGSKSLFGDMDSYFKKNNIDMLLVLSGNYHVEYKDSNYYGETIGTLVSGMTLGVAFAPLGGLFKGETLRPDLAYSLMAIDRTGTPVFVAFKYEYDCREANMLFEGSVDTAAKEIVQKLKGSL